MGMTPGVGIMRVKKDGRDGEFLTVAPMSNKNTAGAELADAHAMALRVKPSRKK
jgi:hypothetical protein